MKNMCRRVSSFIVTLVIFSSIASVGCTSHPNAEQLQALEEQKNAALAAENTLEERKKEKSELESTLQAKQKELEDAKKELEAVKRRLNQ